MSGMDFDPRGHMILCESGDFGHVPRVRGSLCFSALGSLAERAMAETKRNVPQLISV